MEWNISRIKSFFQEWKASLHLTRRKIISWCFISLALLPCGFGVPISFIFGWMVIEDAADQNVDPIVLTMLLIFTLIDVAIFADVLSFLNVFLAAYIFFYGLRWFLARKCEEEAIDKPDKAPNPDCQPMAFLPCLFIGIELFYWFLAKYNIFYISLPTNIMMYLAIVPVVMFILGVYKKMKLNGGKITAKEPDNVLFPLGDGDVYVLAIWAGYLGIMRFYAIFIFSMLAFIAIALIKKFLNKRALKKSNTNKL